jgi:phosphotransacetylase
MLSNKKIICPINLLNVAKKSGIIDAAIVNAGEIFPMESVYMAVKHNLINPIFIGNQDDIKKYADKLEWDISKYKIIDEKNENNTAPIAAKLASEDKVKIIVKGHIHTDILMKAILKRDLNLIGKKRLSHVWHMTLEENDKPFIITDGVVNVLPKLEVKMHILRNSVEFANKIGIKKPKVAVLSATEEIIESVPSSIDANIITKRAKEEGINADVFGPLAFDNSVSKKSAAIKKIKNNVSGETDILLVPNVESGNALVKMMIYFMGACAAGVVIGGKAPVVITSRADEAEARLASIAAAVVSLN